MTSTILATLLYVTPKMYDHSKCPHAENPFYHEPRRSPHSTSLILDGFKTDRRGNLARCAVLIGRGHVACWLTK